MSVRPLTRDDLPAVVALYQRVIVGATAPPSNRLLRALERATLDHPWAEPDLPSLVYESTSGGVAGFQAAYARRLMLGDRPVRMVCCGQLVADPDAATLGIGGLLMRRMLSGPQDFTVTDGATSEVRSMWSRLGGSSGGITSLGWTRIFRPAQLAVRLAAGRRGWARRPAGSGRMTAAKADEELTPDRLIDQIGRTRARLRPAYSVEFLDWLFAEMEAVQRRGPLARRVVTDEHGQALGWYVAYLPSSGVAQAIGVGSVRSDPGPVLDRLFEDARTAGASAVQGRVEHATIAALTARRCVFRRSEWALAHYADDEVAAAAGREQALITRLDGEWWMGYHLERRRPWGAVATRASTRPRTETAGSRM